MGHSFFSSRHDDARMSIRTVIVTVPPSAAPDVIGPLSCWGVMGTSFPHHVANAVETTVLGQLVYWPSQT
jgi:hypothetical protein